MKRLYIFLLASIMATSSIAQTGVASFTGNNFTWSQATNGMLFNDFLNPSPGLESPINSGLFSMYTHNLLFGGIDQSGTLHTYYQLYCSNPAVEPCVAVHGPLRIGGEPNASSDVEQFNRFWFVTSEQIDMHISYFECVNNPDCDASLEFPAYQIPADIMNWPAHGDTDLGYAEYLAPFFDFNNDGIYNAEEGDYPNFCGDFTSYLIHNDTGTEETMTIQESAGLEIHTQVYGYDTLLGAVFNTLFVRQKVINRSNETYENSYLGNFTDFDIGNPNDDYIGTDVARSMYYAYNGDVFDENPTGGVGYGDDLAALGIRYLSGPSLDDDAEDNSFDDGETYGNVGPGWGDGIVDNEHHGLGSTIVTVSGGPSATETPSNAVHLYNNLRGIWRNGVPLTFGGTGYVANCPTCILSDYSFPGNTDPLNFGTEGIDPDYPDPNGWTEESEGLPPGDRRVITGTGPFTFAPGDSQTLDYAVIFARDSYELNLTPVETLQQYADEIVGMQCGELPDVTTGIFETPKQLKFKAYPNPATDRVNIQLPKTFQHVRVEVLDMQSRIIYSRDLSQTDKGQIDLDVAKGQYVLRVIADGEIGVSKFTKM